MRGAPYVPYIATYQGRTTLYDCLAGLTLRLLGHGVPQLRVTSVALGSLTVAVLFLLARPLTGSFLAFLVAALLAVSRWHVTFSRIALRDNPRSPRDRARPRLPSACASRGARARLDSRGRGTRRRSERLHGLPRGRARDSDLCRDRARPPKAALGRGSEARFSWAASSSRSRRSRSTPFRTRAWSRNARAFSRCGTMCRETGGSLRPLLDNLLKTLGSLHLRGDPSSLNNLPGAPLLDPVTGVLVLVGVAWALLSPREPVARLVLIFIAFVGSVDVLSNASEAPSARRILGLLPVLLLGAGVAVRTLSEKLPRRAPRGARRRAGRRSRVRRLLQPRSILPTPGDRLPGRRSPRTGARLSGSSFGACRAGRPSTTRRHSRRTRSWIS